MSIFTGQNKTANFHILHSHQYCSYHHYQCIVKSNMDITSQKRCKNLYASKKYAMPTAKTNFFTICSGCTTALLLFQKQITLRVTENSLCYKFF